MTATLPIPGGTAASRETIRALSVDAPARARVAEVSRPEPESGDVRIALQGCGVCASSLPVWEGRPWFTYPLEPGAPGHEGWGVIEAIGSGVRTVSIGDRVACLSQHAFSENDIAAESELVRLDGIADDVPFPAEAFGCAMNIAHDARIAEGDLVAVIGVGFLGAVLIALAVSAGAQVVAISRRRWSLDLARDLGACETVPLDDHDRVISRLRAIRAAGVDIAIEATGAQWPLDVASEITREEGRLVIAGYHQDGARSINLQHWNWRAFDIVNAHHRDPRAYLDGMRRAVDATRAGILDPARFISHTVSLGDTGDAFALLQNRPDGFLKAVVRP